MNKKLLKFPCLFPIKVMGINTPELLNEVVAIISRNVMNFNPQTDVTSKLSKQGNYLSVTATIVATSQEQLDKLYTELNNHELVKITL